MKAMSLILLLFFLSCFYRGKDSSTSPTAPTPAQEVWTLSDGLSGELTLDRSTNGVVTVQGLVVTASGDSLGFSDAGVTINFLDMSISIVAYQINNDSAVCTLAVDGRLFEGVGNGQGTLTYSTGATQQVAFSAVKTLGSGISFIAASLPNVNRQGNYFNGTETNFTYTILNDTILNVWISYSVLQTYCYNDSVVTYRDSFAHPMTAIIYLSGNQLTITYPSLHDFEQSMSQVVETAMLTRNVSGSGLIGNWEVKAASYQVTSGTLTEEEKDDIDESIEEMIGQIWQITDSNLIIPDSLVWADDFIDDWSRLGSSRYNITVTKLSGGAVKLAGQVSGDIVVIAIDNSGNESYYSSVYGDSSHTWYRTATTCPNNMEPSWYSPFLSENRQ
jgi:hypothetical protein